MRRVDDTKKFKVRFLFYAFGLGGSHAVSQGSVFCEFANFDDVAKFLEADPKPQWQGTELLTMSKDAYCEMKIKEKGLSGQAAKAHKLYAPVTKKGFNAFNLKDSKDKAKGQNLKKQEKPDIFLEFMGKRLKVNEEDGGSVLEAEIPFTKGATLKFVGCGNEATFSDIKVATPCLHRAVCANILLRDLLKPDSRSHRSSSMYMAKTRD